MIKQLETVVLTEGMAKHGLKRGDAGTVVLLHGDAGYEVEFVSLKGQTLTAATLASHQGRPLGETEIAQARIVESTAR